MKLFPLWAIFLCVILSSCAPAKTESGTSNTSTTGASSYTGESLTNSETNVQSELEAQQLSITFTTQKNKPFQVFLPSLKSASNQSHLNLALSAPAFSVENGTILFGIFDNETNSAAFEKQNWGLVQEPSDLPADIFIKFKNKTQNLNGPLTLTVPTPSNNSGDLLQCFCLINNEAATQLLPTFISHNSQTSSCHLLTQGFSLAADSVLQCRFNFISATNFASFTLAKTNASANTDYLIQNGLPIAVSAFASNKTVRVDFKERQILYQISALAPFPASAILQEWGAGELQYWTQAQDLNVTFKEDGSILSGGVTAQTNNDLLYSSVVPFFAGAYFSSLIHRLVQAGDSTFDENASSSQGLGASLLLKTFLANSNLSEFENTFKLILSQAQNSELFKVMYEKAVSALADDTQKQTVQALYQKYLPKLKQRASYSSAANWNKWLQVQDKQVLNEVCDLSKTKNYLDCQHGSELREVFLSTELGCTDLQISDSLNLFTWACDDQQVPVRIYSKAFADGKGLKDVIDADLLRWKTIVLKVSHEGNTLWETNAEQWWENEILEVPSAGTLSQSDAVYVARGAAAAVPWTVSAHSVSLWASTSAALAQVSDQALLSVNNQNFFYAEGDFSSTVANSQPLIILKATQFSQLRNLKLRGTAHQCLALEAVTKAQFYHLQFDQCGQAQSGLTNLSDAYAAFKLSQQSNFNLFKAVSFNNNYDLALLALDSNYNHWQDLQIQKSAYGVYLNNSNSNLWQNTRIAKMSKIAVYSDSSATNFWSQTNLSQNGSEGTHSAFYFKDSHRNTVTQSLITHNFGMGVLLQDSYNNIFNGLSLQQNGTGITFKSSVNNLLLNTVLAFNGSQGLKISLSDSNTAINLQVLNNGLRGIDVSNSILNKFTGKLHLAENGDTTCSNSNVDDQGIKQDCTLSTPSDATLTTTAKNIANSFVGASTDSLNTHGAAGLLSTDQILDWLGFQNIFRAWSPQATEVFPSADNQQLCVSAGNCRIVDWRLKSNDTLLLGFNPSLSASSESYLMTHVWYAFDQDACLLIPNATWDESTCSSTFMSNAAEASTYSAFSDKPLSVNGLCQNNEDCLYFPNTGAYQGEGNLTSAPLTNTQIPDVRLKKFEQNGL